MQNSVEKVLLHLCEAESISYLDEIASTPQSMNLAKSVALEVLELLKTMFARDPKQLNACSDKNYPIGLLQLNAMRLTDIFSDDSNFRFYITTYFLFPHQEFLSSWCSSDLPFPEEDATVEFDSHVASGCVLDSLSSSDLLNVMSSGFTLIPSIMPRASYAHQRVSLLVKIIANLHCFAPKICKEEKDVFLNKFLECLPGELPESSASDAEKARIVIKNLRFLLSHAESLTPPFLNDEDVQLLRTAIPILIGTKFDDFVQLPPDLQWTIVTQYLLEAIDLILQGAQNLVVPIKSNSRRKLQESPIAHNGCEFC
ncbi:unnamed protein product [Camellia sinensis]